MHETGRSPGQEGSSVATRGSGPCGLPRPSPSFDQLALSWPPPFLRHHTTGYQESRGLQRTPTPTPALLALQLQKLAASCSSPRGTGQAPEGLIGESQKEREPLGNFFRSSTHWKIPCDLEGARFYPNTLMSRNGSHLVVC